MSMKRVIATAILLVMAFAWMLPASAEDMIHANGYYEIPAEKTDEILAGQAGVASTEWTVPYLPFDPIIDGRIEPGEYVHMKNYTEYLSLIMSDSIDPAELEALKQEVERGMMSVYWGWDGVYFYFAVQVRCVDGYQYDLADGEQILLFTQNCLQVGFADADAQGVDASYVEVGVAYRPEDEDSYGKTYVQAYYGDYDVKDEDFAAAAGSVAIYETRFDLKSLCGKEIKQGDSLGFSFSLNVSGDGGFDTNKYISFCEGMILEKSPQNFATITFEQVPGGVVIGPEIPRRSGVVYQDITEFIDFGEESVFATLSAVGAEIEQVTEKEETFLRITALNDGCYVTSRTYPRNVNAQTTRYLVMKYRTSSPAAQTCGLTWTTRDSPIVALERCYPAPIRTSGEWEYVLLDMQNCENWQDYIQKLTLAPFLNQTDVASQTFDVAWIATYETDPILAYMESFGVELGTEGPATEPLETETPFIDWETEPVTEPIVEDTLADELETEETPGDKPERPGLFYEFFGDVEWTGCKRTSPGYTGLGCMGTGCTSAAGGLLLLSLIAAGLVFRKKDE